MKNKPQWLIDAENAINESSKTKFGKMSDKEFRHYMARSNNFMTMVSNNDYEEIQNKRKATLGEEGLKLARKKQINTLGKEKLSQIAQKREDSLSTEAKKARTKKANETLGAEKRSERSKKRAETIGKEKLSEIAKKGRAKIPFEIKSAGAKKAQASSAETKRQKANILYKEVLTQLPDTFTSRQAKDVLIAMGYKEARWLQMKQCDLIEMLPLIGKPNQHNPEKYRKLFGENQ